MRLSFLGISGAWKKVLWLSAALGRRASKWASWSHQTNLQLHSISGMATRLRELLGLVDELISSISCQMTSVCPYVVGRFFGENEMSILHLYSTPKQNKTSMVNKLVDIGFKFRLIRRRKRRRKKNLYLKAVLCFFAESRESEAEGEPKCFQRTCWVDLSAQFGDNIFQALEATFN